MIEWYSVWLLCDQNLRGRHLVIVPLKNCYEDNVIAGQGNFTAAGMLGIDDITTVYTYYMSSREALGNCCPKPKAADLKTGHLLLINNILIS